MTINTYGDHEHGNRCNYMLGMTKGRGKDDNVGNMLHKKLKPLDKISVIPTPKGW